ncbi:RhoGEF domain protein, partial [Spraguea lophii 42_110]
MLKESINLDNNDTQETSVIKKYKDGLDRNTGQHINDDRSFVVTDSNIDIRNNDYYEKYWMYNFDAPLNTFSYFYYNRNLCDIFSNLSLKASKALNHNSLNIYILSVYPIGAVIINVCTYTNSGYVRSILGSRRYFFEASHLPSSMLIKKYKLLKNTYQAYIQDQAKNTSLDIGKRQISVKKDEPFSIFKNISAFFFNKKSKKRRSNAEASIASTASTGSRSKDFKKLIEINKQKFLDLYVNFIELDEKENIKIRDIDTIMIDEENTVDVYLEECLHNKKNNSKNDSDSQSTEKYDNNKNDPEALKNLVKKYGSMVNYITKPLGNLMPTEEFELIKKDYGRNKGILERIKNIRCKKDVNKIFLSLREFYITEFNYYKLMNKFNIGYLKRFLDQRTSSSDKNGMLKKTMFNNIFGHFLEVIKTEQAFLGSLLNNLGVASSDMQKQYLDKEGEKVIEDVISMKFDQMEKGIASGGENINVNFERVVLGVFKSFTQNVKNFKSYKYFCTTYSHSLELIKQNFKHKYIKNVFDKDNIISEIESYFILPVQRIIRYKLYLEGMYKSMFNSDGNGVIHMNNSKITSRAILSIMVEAIRLVAEFLQVLNDDRERYEMGRLAFMVQGKVNNCPSNILTKSRGYITQLPCMLYFSNGSNNKKTQTSNISLFLYTDIIMVVERDGEGTNIFQGDKDTQYNYLKHSELINT